MLYLNILVLSENTPVLSENTPVLSENEYTLTNQTSGQFRSAQCELVHFIRVDLLLTSMIVNYFQNYMRKLLMRVRGVFGNVCLEVKLMDVSRRYVCIE